MWRVTGQRLLVRRRPLMPIWASQTQAEKPLKLWPLSLTTHSTQGTAATRTHTSGPRHRSSSRRNGSPRRGETYSNNQNAMDAMKKRANELLDKLSTFSSCSETMALEELQDAVDTVNAWSAEKLPIEAQHTMIPLVDNLFTRILEKQIHDNDVDIGVTTIPNSISFCSIINAWSRSDLPHAAERAECWLHEMTLLSEKFPDRITPPRPSLFSSVLSAWEKRASSDPEIATRHAEALWHQLHGYCKGSDDENTSSVPSSAYYMYLSLWSKSDLPEAADQAERILREMVDAGRRNTNVIPTSPAFINAITAWRRMSNRSEAHLRAQGILDLMVRECLRRRKLPEVWMKMTVDAAPFNATIQCWATAAKIENSGVTPTRAGKQINEILKTMNELSVQPTTLTVRSILPPFESLQDEINEPVQNFADKILQLLSNAKGSTDTISNMVQNQTFLKAIELCCRESSKSKNESRSAEVAEEILFQLYMKLPRKQRRLDPIMQAFVSVVQAWNHQMENPNLSSNFASQRMQAVLVRMEEESDRIYQHKGNPSVYAFLARAWALNSGSSEALDRVEKNLALLSNLYACYTTFPLRLCWFNDIVVAVEENFSVQQSNEFCRRLFRTLTADSQQFSQLISSGCSSEINFDVRDREFLDRILTFLAGEPSISSGKRAEMVLLKMQEMQEKRTVPPLTFQSLKKVLLCWAGSTEDGAARRADDILSLAEDLYKNGDATMRPDLDGYMAVIIAWSQSRSPDAPEMIKKHLQEIRRRRAEGDRAFGVNDEMYASLIRAYANSGRNDAATMAQAIFDAAPAHLRTTSVYNALIEAQGGDANYAEDLLQCMHHMYKYEENELVKPDTDTFNAVIQAWLRSGSPMTAWRADGIFKRMEDLTENGHLDVRPNSRTFDLIISALAQGIDVELKIDAYLSLLRQHYRSGRTDCTPTVTSYTEAMKVWCSKEDDPRAVLRAKALLDEMHELAREGLDGIRPNRKTYEVYLKALSQSSVEARAELAKDAVRKMKENSVEVDGDIHRCLQRCFLPSDHQISSFVVKIEDGVP